MNLHNPLPLKPATCHTPPPRVTLHHHLHPLNPTLIPLQSLHQILFAAMASGDQQFPPQKQERQPGKEHVMDPTPQFMNPNYKPADKLRGKVALVTGGDSGIGRAVCYCFAKEGATIAFTYVKGQEEKDAEDTIKIVKEAKTRGAKDPISIPTDLGYDANCKAVVDEVVGKYGRIDVLVNNAAEQYMCRTVEEIDENWLDRVFRTNIYSYFFVTRHALKHMKEGSSIINTTSVNAYKGNATLLDYTSTKGAIVSFIRGLALQLASKNIRVNGVAPGPVWTPLIPSSFHEEKTSKFGSECPMKRAAHPHEIAPSFVFLACDDSSYYTGQVLHPNGGMIVNDVDKSLKPSESRFDSDRSESRKLYKFDVLAISIATEKFCDANKIWQDQNGSMYKGMLQNGQKVAIKKLYGTIHEHIFSELLVKLEHEDLVQLLGYCLEKTASFLVYDFSLCKTLDQFIFDPIMCTLLDWNKRHEMILGVASALLYLHECGPTRIIHVDVRPENILFDENMDPKLSYVESEIYLAINGTDCINVDKICGTMGYMAPEYMVEGCLSPKVDVFGFGLLVLETISGQRNYTHFPMTNENFVQYVWKNWLKGTNSNITDPTIDVDTRMISRFIQIGLLCVQADETDRPTMHEVVGMLRSSSRQDLLLPKNPVSSWIMEEVSDYINATPDDYDPGAVKEFESELSPR
ncbi:hypothetical protein SSX86_021272 [Deinandra increscens subsp. villosa]|uniref:non-specific serine/threonine protein kinase n=1 Tax=Deinandra increscens subsp. villosa TaxID=3103831 RepID=A0AAP0GU16_9ASTR